MVFPSIEFGIFFPVVLALSWALMSRPRAWKPFMLVASYAFYSYASWRFGLLLAGVTLGNQLFAVLVHRAPGERRRRWLVRLAVALDLGVLGVFKYYGFFAQEVDDTLRIGLPLVALALPIGVSFYTFQAISYVVDVGRRVIAPARTVDAALYLSFFPHVVAGPIVRAREFLPQLERPRDPDDVAVGTGALLIAIGLVKKVMLADFLARTVVDPVFAVPQAYGGPDVLLAAYAYAGQIYCDFSGYTDIAIGAALMLGFVFPRNFNRPYRSASFQEFWRRWHMTLSRFLRDFLYIPLGGNRGGRWFTYRNLMLTMLLGGLWHGAAWTFVIWGGVHGAALVLERIAKERLGWHVPAVVRWFVVFHVVVFAWVLFRSQDLSLAWTFLGRLGAGGALTLMSLPVGLALFAAVGVQLLPPRPLEALRLRLEQMPAVALGVGLALVVVFVGATVPSAGVPPFIYFRF